MKKDLVLYGSDFFNTFQTSFSPINEPNPDSGYARCWRCFNYSTSRPDDYIEDFPVNQDGAISMPDIGKITDCWTFSKRCFSVIKSKVNSAFIGTEAFINLAELRDVNILVTGNAKNPGIYTLTGNSNILHAFLLLVE